LITTYEHGITALLSANAPPKPGEKPKNKYLAQRIFNLVIIDEVHEITNTTRGVTVDDLVILTRACGCRALAMSGTLDLFTECRLTNTYPTIFTRVVKDQVFKLDTEVLYVHQKNPWDNRALESWKGPLVALAKAVTSKHMRMIIFCGTIQQTEEVYIMLLQMLDLSKLTSIIQTETSLVRFAKLDTPSKILEAFAKGIYIHHAQLKPSKISDLSGKWRDVLETQLANDFKIVVCTSTLAVGLNLAPAQVCFLLHSDVWSTAQVMQMIGRVGRDGKPSLAIVVQSEKFNTPTPLFLNRPLYYFLPRFLGLLPFGQTDLRGFYRPTGSSRLGLIDQQFNSLNSYAFKQELVHENFNKELTIAQDAEWIMKMSTQDIRMIPVTTELFHNTTNITISELLLWVFLQAGFPQGVFTSTVNLESTQTLLLDSMSSSEELQKCARMLDIYNITHSLNLLATDQPSPRTLPHLRVFLSEFLYGFLVDPQSFYEKYDTWVEPYQQFAKVVIQIADHVGNALQRNTCLGLIRNAIIGIMKSETPWESALELYTNFFSCFYDNWRAKLIANPIYRDEYLNAYTGVVFEESVETDLESIGPDYGFEAEED
jgi:hypothetical protein